MFSYQTLKIKLTREEKRVLDDAADVFEDILSHLILNKDVGNTEHQKELDIYDNFWKIYDICINIEKDKLIPEK